MSPKALLALAYANWHHLIDFKMLETFTPLLLSQRPVPDSLGHNPFYKNIVHEMSPKALLALAYAN